MSQKNETAVLLVSLLVTAGLVGTGLWWLTNRRGTNGIVTPTPTSTQSNSSTTTNPLSNGEILNRFSQGERVLIPGEVPVGKQAGVEAIAANNYQAAISNFEQSLKSKRNDPESLIYLNNSQIADRKSYTIATSVPIGSDVNASLEILRGVAQAQTEINQGGGIKGIPLKVLITNDDNNPEIAQAIAKALVANSQVLGVIGHFGSEITLAASKFYQSGQLVLISPTSTSVQLSGVGNYIFRTVPSDRFAANALSRYLLTKLQKKKVALFFNSNSNYSKSLKDEFTTAVYGDGGQVVSEFDFANPGFNPADAVQQAIAQKTDALMLAPNSATLDKALQVVQVSGGRLPILAGDSAYTAKTLQLGAANAVGMILAVPWHILADPQSKFPQTAKTLWGGEVNWRTALAYDATKALIAALEQNPTRSGLQQTLSSSNFSTEGASGSIRFLPSGDRNRAVQLVTVQPGTRTSYRYEFVPLP